MFPLNKPKIDSLRILVPIKDIIVNHNEFLNNTFLINQDSEVLSEELKTTYFNTKVPISCSYAYAPNLFFNNEQCDVVKIGFSSKTLKKLYFNGIDKYTIKHCFDFINNEGVLTISKDAFLNAKVVDVDICFDIYLQDTHVKEVVSISNELTIPRKNTTQIKYLSNINTGIQWSRRNGVGKAYNTKQFLKYYAKAIELKNNSNDFYKTYLEEEVNQDYIFADGTKYTPPKYFDDNKLLRVETTIKNKEHWQTYGVKVETLNDLLKLDLYKHLYIFNRPINHYMKSDKRIAHRVEFTPTEEAFLLLIETQSKLKKIPKIDTIPYIAIRVTKNKSQKSNYNKKLTKLLEASTKSKKNNNNTKLNTIDYLENISLIPKH